MATCTQSVIDILIHTGAVKCEERELYIFGLQQIGFAVLNLCTTIIIACCFGMIWQCGAVCAVYMSMRSSAGGYHARTPQICYILSSAMTAVSLSVIRMLDGNNLIYCILVCICGVFIFLLVPVESKNKPLDSLEIETFKKRSRYILGIWIAAFAMSIKCGWTATSAILTTAIAMLCLMLLFGAAELLRKSK